jgi:hypothetical protein
MSFDRAGLTCQVLLILFSLACANKPTFVLPLGDEGNLTFAISASTNSQDLEIYLATPTLYSWAAIGTGEQMKGSLMFVAYQNSSGTGWSYSPPIRQ